MLFMNQQNQLDSIIAKLELTTNEIGLINILIDSITPFCNNTIKTTVTAFAIPFINDAMEKIMQYGGMSHHELFSILKNKSHGIQEHDRLLLKRVSLSNCYFTEREIDLLKCIKTVLNNYPN